MTYYIQLPDDILEDLKHAQLPRSDNTDRLWDIARTIADAPELSLPEACANPSKLTGAHRFLGNELISPDEILAPHTERTALRAALKQIALVIHDTTKYSFGGSIREGLGVVDPFCEPGFYMHWAFCVGFDGEPLGVLHRMTWIRTGETKGKRTQNETQYDDDSESIRWHDGVHQANVLIRYAADKASLPEPRVIHIMDREGDSLVLLADMLYNGHHFVVRAETDRRLEPGRKATDNKMFAAVQGAPVQCKRIVPIVRTKKEQVVVDGPKAKGGKKGRQRTGTKSHTRLREAQLEIRAKTVRVFGANGCHGCIPTEGIELNIVHVQEVNAPEGVEPVCWYLVTDQPIGTPEEVEFVVDCYRIRWLIEEAHKAIKTGCKYEAHQFRSGNPYYRLLSIVLVVAVRMLRLRWFSRNKPDADALEAFTEEEIEALRIYQEEKGSGPPLPAKPTVAQVTRLVARLGGHVPQNGEPGWLVLLRGLEALKTLTEHYLLFRGRASPKTSNKQRSESLRRGKTKLS